VIVVNDTAWHPPLAVLDIVELVLDGALPPLGEVLALLGVPTLRELVTLADPTCQDPPDPPVTVEDAEGNPVARMGGGLELLPGQPFTAPPLRAHRRPRSTTGTDTLTAAVVGLAGAVDVDDLVSEAAGRGLRLRLLVLVGHGRGPLPPQGAWRAAGGIARHARERGVDTDVVPVAVPLIAVPGRADVAGEPGEDPLAAEVTRRYADRGPWKVLASAPPDRAAGPALAELARTAPPPFLRGATVFLTGLSGSGKSTIAKGLAARLDEDGRRAVTLLDGDEVRRLLSHGLGFSRSDRDLNIRRIGFVATEVTRHGGIAICAPIAPFAAVRARVRAAVEEVGDFILIHVATPLGECERRDRKGLYARARRGQISDFTGISSPYEEPRDADLVVDTTGRSVEEVVGAVWALLEKRGYLGQDL
jgi:sulfate adenylyltransferase